MITARVKNGRFYVDDPTDEVMDIIRTEYSIIDPKSRMIRSEYPVEPVRFYRTRKCGDNNLRVLHVSQMMGLAERTISIFKRHGISLVIPKPEHSPIRFRSACTGATLDPIQLEVVHALLKVRRGVSELSVGSGKTIVMAELAGSFFLETGLPSVIVVPKKQLLHQSYAELQRFLPGIKIGMIGDSKRIPGDICIATAQTLTSAMLDEETAKWMAGVGMITVDESHHVAAPSYSKFLSNHPGIIIWALSGKVTFANDKIQELRLEQIMGQPVIKARNEVRLCPVEVLFYDGVSKKWPKSDYPAQKESGMEVWHMPRAATEWVKGIYILDGTEGSGTYIAGRKINISGGHTLYATAEDFGMVLCGARNKWCLNLVKELLERPLNKVVVTVARSVHALIMSSLLTQNGIDHILVNGNLKGKAQQDAFRRMDEGDLRVIVAQYSCMMEGTNVRSLTDLIILNGPVSDQTLEQLKGRVERQLGGKEMGRLHIPGDFHHAKLRGKVRKIRKYFSTIRVTCRTIK